jgi:hypothetical protein
MKKLCGDADFGFIFISKKNRHLYRSIAERRDLPRDRSLDFVALRSG